MSIREDALAGKVTPIFEACAKQENVTVEFLMEGVAKGTIAITKNIHHDFDKIVAVGKGLSTKVNANIGASKDYPEAKQELEKLEVCLKAGADTVMDLSLGDNINEVRKGILADCPIPLGTVPVYQIVADIVENQDKAIGDVTVQEMLACIEEQAKDGVDFMTIHSGITREALRRLKGDERITGVVSRGGSFTLEWMSCNNAENPFFEYYDDILAILKEHEVTMSLGDGFRPGCCADATDRGQLQELIHLGELTQRAWDAGVQVIVEGPGHMPLDQITANILLQKKICHGAPFYVLGPLVTDIAPGYDHITGAIGGAIAASVGADYLCYVTPAEHLKLPSAEDVHEGIMASRIAAHAADIVKGVPGAFDKDIAMAKCRNNLDWKGQIDLSIDPVKAKRYREMGGSYKGDACAMCGDYCAMKVYKKATKPGRCPSEEK